jgi:hypothetical protein
MGTPGDLRTVYGAQFSGWTRQRLEPVPKHCARGTASSGYPRNEGLLKRTEGSGTKYKRMLGGQTRAESCSQDRDRYWSISGVLV